MMRPCVRAELVFGVDEDQAALARQRLPARKQRQRIGARLSPIALWSAAPARHDLGAESGSSWPPSKALLVGVMIACGQLLIVAQAIGQAHAVHVARALLVERQDRGARGAGEIAAHHDLDGQDVEPLPITTLGSGYSSTWFGQISAVFSNQKRAVWVST
jgi:hypothetical protein